MELPSFATNNVKAAYVNIKGVLLKHLEISPVFWNWVAAGFLTRPTLKKILNLEKLLIETRDLSGEIFEFGSGLGTKAFVLLNLQGALNQTICKVNAFEYFQGYSTTGKLSLAEHKQSIIDGYSAMHGNIKTTSGIPQDQDILSLNDVDLSTSSPGGYEDYDGAIKLSFIDVQSGDLSLSLLNWSCSRLESGGVIVVEGFNSPFFPDVTESLKDFVAPVGFERIELDWEFTFAIKKLS
jgi:hypothetical protein